MIQESPVPDKEVQHAIRKNDLEELKRLWERDKDLFRRETKSGTWLYRAAANGGQADEELYRFILDHGGKEVIETLRYGRYYKTPLFIARLNGEILAEKVLREYGADSSPEAMNGFNDLHFLGLNTCLIWQLQDKEHYRPADFHALNYNRMTPLDCMTNDPLLISDSLRGALAFLLEGRAHFHPDNGLWQPKDPDFVFNQLAQHELLPVLFRPEYWKGIEGEALKLRDGMFKVLLEEPMRAKLAEIDFSPFERASKGSPESSAVRYLKAKESGPGRHGGAR